MSSFLSLNMPSKESQILNRYGISYTLMCWQKWSSIMLWKDKNLGMQFYE